MYNQLARFYSLKETELSAPEHRGYKCKRGPCSASYKRCVCFMKLPNLDKLLQFFFISSMGIVMTDLFQLL